jgi:hypothetical protein
LERGFHGGVAYENGEKNKKNPLFEKLIWNIKTERKEEQNQCFEFAMKLASFHSFDYRYLPNKSNKVVKFNKKNLP